MCAAEVPQQHQSSISRSCMPILSATKAVDFVYEMPVEAAEQPGNQA